MKVPHASRHGVEQRFIRPFVGHVCDIDAGREPELFGIEMRAAADTGRGEVDLSGLLFRERDQLVHVPHAECRRDHDDAGGSHDLAHGREVPQRIERQFRVERCAHRKTERVHEQRIAVRCGPGHDTHAHHAARTPAVVHDDLLARVLGHLRPDSARDEIARAPRRETAPIIRIGLTGNFCAVCAWDRLLAIAMTGATNNANVTCHGTRITTPRELECRKIRTESPVSAPGDHTAIRSP